MKHLLMTVAVLGGIFLGFFPSISKPKPVWWKLIVVASLLLTCFLALYPPIGGTLLDAAMMSTNTVSSINITVKPISTPTSIDATKSSIQIEDYSKKTRTTKLVGSKELVESLVKDTKYILRGSMDTSHTYVTAERIIATNPSLILPYMFGLDERARILYFHVPMAWIACLAYLISMVYAIQYLRKRTMEYDRKSASTALIGTITCILATITGAVWAQFNWGYYWNWDPRQTTIFVLLLVYGAYFVLRSAIQQDEPRARLSSVYAILAFVTVPFLIFIIPRITESLHPGGAGSENIGPVLSTDEDALNPFKQIIFSLSLFSFIIAFFWVVNVHFRTVSVSDKMKKMFLK